MSEATSNEKATSIDETVAVEETTSVEKKDSTDKKSSKDKKSGSEEKAPKKSWFKGLKSEFKKIIWPEKKHVARQTTAVVLITAVLGVLIVVIDYLVKLGFNKLF